MAKVKVGDSSSSKKRLRPALTPEARENQLIALAYDLVEKRMLEGTATSQETTHFLKLGSTKHKLEMEKLKSESKLATAKADMIEATRKMDELYQEAIDAMRNYSGHGDPDEY